MVINKQNLKLLFPLVLGTQSPRRQEIMKMAGFSFETEVFSTPEEFDESLNPNDVPIFLADQKAEHFMKQSHFRGLALFADTVVIIDEKILNKPANSQEATRMLKLLSGRQHRVVTGVCLLTPRGKKLFSDTSLVTFKELSDHEIAYYIEVCRPFDKAGSYGIQDFIGMVGIPHIEGSFYTVMGLPIHKVYEALEEFIVWG